MTTPNTTIPVSPNDPPAPDTAGYRRPRLLYVITEDWFFCSHFLPMARAALAAGHEVSLAARFGRDRERIEAEGIRTYPLSFQRGRFNPISSLLLVLRLALLYRRIRADLVHHISLKPVVLGSLAGRLVRVPVMVNAITGFGYLFINKDPSLKRLRQIVGDMLRLTVGAPASFCLLENHDDRQLLIDQQLVRPERITVVGGAGVDPEQYPALPLPEHDPTSPRPLVLALVARMLWSKGVDLAVKAVQLARAQGSDVELHLVGEPDPLNPAAVSREQLLAWQQLPGIRWLGRSDNVVAVWSQADIALLPSRGGEGLPRSLIEAAACARPIIATDVPGCREIVIDGENGLLVPPGKVETLAEAIMLLAQDGERRATMAAASRRHFETRFTEAVVCEAVTGLYRQALGWAVNAGRCDPTRN